MMLFGMSAGQCLEICSPYLEEITKFLYGKKTFKEIGTVFQTLVAKLELRVKTSLFYLILKNQ